MSTRNYPLPVQGIDDHDSFSLQPEYATLFRNVRSNRRRIVRAPGGTLLAPSPSESLNIAISQGLIQSPLTTGAVTYDHTLGVAPKAFIFSVNTLTPQNSVDTNYATGWGFSDLTREGGASHACANGQTTTVVWKGYKNASIFLIQTDGTELLRATVTAVTTTTFTVTWAVVDPLNQYNVSFTTLGGAGLSAYMKEWQTQAGAGNQSVVGVGFQPDCVMHIWGRQTHAIVAGADVGLAFGVMTAAGDEWTSDTHTIGGTTTGEVAQRGLKTNRCLANLTGIVGNAPAFTAEAKFVSMDVGGFTVNWINPQGGHFIAALCLQGLPNVKAGAFVKSARSAPVLQHVTNVGFAPSWVLLHTVDGDGTGSYTDLRRSHGSSDGNTSYLWSERDVQGALPSDTHQEIRTNAVLSVLGANDAEKYTATFQSLDSDGFTLNWPLNNTDAVTIAYIAISESPSGLGVIRNYAQVYVGAGATVDEKLLMLTSKSAFIYTPSTPSTGIWTPTAESYTGTIYQRFSIVNTQAIAAWSQGVDDIRQWDGTTFGNLVTSGQNHAAKALIAFADRIVSIRPFFGGIDHATQIRWCIDGNVNNWTGAGSGALEVIETSQNPLVTGFVLGERAYLAKQRELIELLWTGTTSPVFGTVPRVRGMGVLAPHSVGLAEQFAFWLGPDDIYMWDGSTLTPIGDRIYNTIDALIDYQNLDTIQGAVWTPDSLYLLVVPPYLFIYDYRRDIWYQDDTTNFEAIGVFSVGTNFTADIDHSEFIVIGDSFLQTVRLDGTLLDYLGAPLDSYWTSKDYTGEELIRGGATPGFIVSLWDLNSLREIRFQSNANYVVEVGVSIDRGNSWQTTMVRTNDTGVGVAWFQVAFSQIRFRFRSYDTVPYEIHGTWGLDFEPAGYQFPNPNPV